MIMAIVTSVSTTIQASKKTAQLLRELMKKTGAKSYDEVIAAMAREKLSVPKSMFGSNPRLGHFTEKDELESHGL